MAQTAGGRNGTVGISLDDLVDPCKAVEGTSPGTWNVKWSLEKMGLEDVLEKFSEFQFSYFDGSWWFHMQKDESSGFLFDP